MESPVGKISFGAWGRSTFELGREQIKTTLDVDGGMLDSTLRGAASAFTQAATDVALKEAALEAAKEAWDGSTAANTALETARNNLATAQGNLGTLVANTGTSLGIDTSTPQGLAAAQELLTGLATLYGADSLLDSDSSTNFIRMNPDWSYGCRVGFWIIGRTNDEHFGFDFNLDSDAAALFLHKLYDSDEAQEDTNYLEDGKYAVAIGDQAKIWGIFDAEPVGAQVKLAFGKMRENVLRGSIGDFGQRESSDVKSEDDIFQEFWPVTGMFASVTGLKDTFLEGFYAAGCVDVTGVLGTSAVDKTAGNAGVKGMDMHDVFHNGQYAIGYTIPGWVQVKAQYWGTQLQKQTTAMKNLSIRLPGKLVLTVTTTTDAWNLV